MDCAKTLVEIIRNTPGGITVYTASVNDLCRDIYDETGVMVSPKRLTDTWEVENNWGDTYLRSKPNNRKHNLLIK